MKRSTRYARRRPREKRKLRRERLARSAWRQHYADQQADHYRAEGFAIRENIARYGW